MALPSLVRNKGAYISRKLLLRNVVFSTFLPSGMRRQVGLEEGKNCCLKLLKFYIIYN